MSTPQEESALYSDIKGQIIQYIYRGMVETADPFMAFIQEVSGNGPLNWHLPQHRDKIASVFTKMGEAAAAYSPYYGEFRSYMTIKLVDILFETYKTELVKTFLRNGYNVPLESIMASIDHIYTEAKPQNTNFPRTNNTADEVNPNPLDRLVPPSLYH